MRIRATMLSMLGLSVLAAPVVSGQEKEGSAVSAVEYEGWRQYNVHCARCHGQDALPNPVAANLLTSLAPGGPAAEKGTFTKVVMAGRQDKGMPAFQKIVTPEQVDAMYAYLKGRAEKKIQPGRPKEPAAAKEDSSG
jgi:mono/diheme cytochrome c family protein